MTGFEKSPTVSASKDSTTIHEVRGVTAKSDAKRVSLAPLDPETALRALLATEPDPRD